MVVAAAIQEMHWFSRDNPVPASCSFVGVPFLVGFLLVFGAESLLQSKESSELKSSSCSLYLDEDVIAMLADVDAACQDNVAIKWK